MILGNARLGGDTVDIRIDNGVITQIGSIGSPDIDLAERWVIPGLWDNHVHFTQWALGSQRVDLSRATSAAEAARVVADAVPSASGMVVGGGFRDGLWSDAPHFALLDAVSGDLPVVLVSGDLHAAWLNSAALRRFGHAEHPTGLLREEAAFTVTGQLGDVGDETIDGWARSAADAAAARGVVGISDLEMAWNRDTWERRIAAGHHSLRVEFAIYTEHLERAIAEGLHTGQRLSEWLTVGGYKVLTDGSLNTRTAYTHDDYPGGGRGILTVPPAELLPLMRRASGAGILPYVHAIGDHANTLALDAFEELGVGGRIEHAQLLVASDFARFAALGVAASVQPDHAMDDRDVADALWAGRTGRMYAFRSLLDAGATLLFGSDAPVSPLDPWATIAAAVTRSRGGREPWHPEQCVSVTEALTASTRSTVAVGQPADLVAIERDPHLALGEELRTMPVALTLLGGRATWQSL